MQLKAKIHYLSIIYFNTMNLCTYTYEEAQAIIDQMFNGEALRPRMNFNEALRENLILVNFKMFTVLFSKTDSKVVLNLYRRKCIQPRGGACSLLDFTAS